MPSAKSKSTTSKKPSTAAATLRPASAGAPTAARRRLRNFTKYNVYTRAILKQTHGEKLGMKGGSQGVVNAIIRSMTQMLTAEAVRCKRSAGRTTLTSRDVRGAVRLSFPPVLAKFILATVDNAVAENEQQRLAATAHPAA